MEIKLRDLEIKDLDDYCRLNHPDMLHHQYNGPYFGITTLGEVKDDVEYFRKKLLKGEKEVKIGKIIVDAKTDKLIGSVSYYWKSKETLWLEIGLSIYDDTTWNKGIGYKALKLWTTEVFNKFPEIIRLGFTTWSGNPGMMKLGEKLGFQKEATFRKARIYQGKYYDSISYGILKEEWKG